MEDSATMNQSLETFPSIDSSTCRPIGLFIENVCRLRHRLATHGLSKSTAHVALTMTSIMAGIKANGKYRRSSPSTRNQASRRDQKDEGIRRMKKAMDVPRIERGTVCNLHSPETMQNRNHTTRPYAQITLLRVSKNL